MKKVATMLLLAISVTFSSIASVRAGDPQLPPGPPPCTDNCRLVLAAAPAPDLSTELRVQLLLVLLSVWTR
jgi:hypothetical protein